MKFEMVIFDLDGTLWETEECTYRTANKILKKYDDSKKISMDVVKGTMGSTFAETAECFMPYFDKEKREFILKEMLAFNSDILSVIGGRVYPYLKETLEKLKGKYQLAIVSNCDAGYIESFLESSKLSEYFKDFMAAAKMKIPKSEAIKRVIDRNEINSAIYVGDTIKDFEASKGAGIDFIHARYGFGKKIDTQYGINSIMELPELLNEIEQN